MGRRNKEEGGVPGAEPPVGPNAAPLRSGPDDGTSATIPIAPTARAIKLQAWNGHAMHDVLAIDWLEGGILARPITTARAVSYRWQALHGWVLRQFTGLLDRNGKEIYEGDILCEGAMNGMVVKYRADLASFALAKDGWMYDHFFGEGVTSANCDIVGNCHENPDLLSK